MKYYHQDECGTIYNGDCLVELKKLPSDYVDCCITSPPYFNLRDYGIEEQIGLEKTWQEYIKKLIDVFDEVKRVLKKEGTCFVNLGDSYGGSSSLCKTSRQGFNNDKVGNLNKKFQQKSLMMIPERFAIAMIDNGWILRNKLIWIKPNAMPESVRDRWKKAHEYIFFFTKSKNYYFDLDKIRTPHKLISIKRAEYEQGRNAMGQNPSSVGEKYGRDKKNRTELDKYAGMPARRVKLNLKGAVPPDYISCNTNCSEEDISREHYATYPQKLISPFMRAGCPDKGIILDPFFGSGTTGLVAQKSSKKYIGIEISKEYCAISVDRLRQKPLPL